ncbi:LysR family transcriptional regulator [uncultured Acinetobacter sp.]|uniref:LysR family transcriptional regulator n=1 Tax=uncultured Acinetobacter sp. TaxID=165433 RepID=UPI00258C6350|nr:LysR family transcriptional regulator [uncultured Acinetobacter sp.]
MNFKSIENFYWVARLNSFNKAAVKLNTTQPAVSQRLNTFEQELGVKLLERTSRSLQLTEKGQIVYAYAEKYIQLNHELLKALSEKTALQATIRLGVAETIVHTWLVDFIEQVQQEYPAVTFDIVINITPILKQAVEAGELDMAFLLESSCNFDCVEIPLCQFQHSFLIAPRFHKRFLERQLTLKDVSNSTILTYPKMTYPYMDLKNQLMQHGLKEPKTITSYSLATLIKMTEEGMGIGIIPHLSVIHELREKRLQILPSELVLKPFRFSCVYIAGKDDLVKQSLSKIAQQIAQHSLRKLNNQFNGDDYR